MESKEDDAVAAAMQVLSPPPPIHDSAPTKLRPNGESTTDANTVAPAELHVQALDALVSVNSFFTGAVFIGLVVTVLGIDLSLVTSCTPSSDLPKYILVFEVIAFACYLLSSLMAQGIKLWILLDNANDSSNSHSGAIHPSTLRLGMIGTAGGTIGGTIFLVLSIVNVIQARLGNLYTCDASWSKWAAIPLITLVGTGLLSFISTVIYAFVT